MRAAAAMALSGLSTVAVAQSAQVQSRLQDLLDRGFQIAAEGSLLESVECRRWTMRLIPTRAEEPCFGRVTYGSFKRMKNDSNEFVCVSFHDWACYPARESN